MCHALIVRSGKKIFEDINQNVRWCLLQRQIKDTSPADNLGNRNITSGFRAAVGFTIQKELI